MRRVAGNRPPVSLCAVRSFCCHGQPSRVISVVRKIRGRIRCHEGNRQSTAPEGRCKNDKERKNFQAPEQHGGTEDPLGQVAQGGEIGYRPDDRPETRADVGHRSAGGTETGDEIVAGRGQRDRNDGDGEGIGERKCDDGRNDIVRDRSTPHRACKHRVGMQQALHRLPEHDERDLEAEDLDAARGGAGTSADVGSVALTAAS